MQSFWGKTWREDQPPPFEVVWKPVIHHLLDVAAAALELQAASPRRLEREAAVLGAQPNDFARTRAYFAALHDIGKFSRAFQSKSLELWPDALGEPPSEEIRGRHWVLSGRMLHSPACRRVLDAPLAGLHLDDRGPIIAAIAGHHGAPPMGQDQSALDSFTLHEQVGEAGLAAALRAPDVQDAMLTQSGEVWIAVY
ncbi:MAG: CRISPR-associated endonuclease Cas3'', partial [Pseudomonadota bacterium]